MHFRGGITCRREALVVARVGTKELEAQNNLVAWAVRDRVIGCKDDETWATTRRGASYLLG